MGALAFVGLRGRGRRELRGKVVLITGGSRGLGLILARRFADAGARLALCARHEAELDQARRELESKGAEVFAAVCDVGDPDGARRFVDQAHAYYGRLDVVVNNASIISVGPLEQLSLEDFHDAMDANYWGTVHVTLAALPWLKRQGAGRIVNVSSIGGAVSLPHLLPYSSAKHAVVGFSLGLRAEVAKDGIQVVTVLPGLMRTGSFLHALVKGRQKEETRWFALSASLPVVSMSAQRAADRIVVACVRGEPFVVLGLPAKALRLFHVLAPNASERLFSLAASFLPRASEEGPVQRAEPAARHREGVADSILTALGDRAAAQNNEEIGLPRDRLH